MFLDFRTWTLRQFSCPNHSLIIRLHFLRNRNALFIFFVLCYHRRTRMVSLGSGLLRELAEYFS